MASIRGPRDLIAAAKAGADIATVPFKVLQQAATHPLTDAGLAQFATDWQTFTDREADRSIATPG